MTGERDPLEAELSALRPHSVSPELRERIAARLRENSNCLQAPNPDHQKRIFAARSLSGVFNRPLTLLAGSLAAACLLAVLIRFGGGRGVDSQATSVGPQPVPLRGVEDADSGETQPTLLVYQRALARSPEELDALLNKHALVTPVLEPQLVPIGAFTRSDAAIHALLGDD